MSKSGRVRIALTAMLFAMASIAATAGQVFAGGINGPFPK